MKTIKLSCIISLLCATFLPLHILAQAVNPSPVGEIPFTLDNDNRIYVTAFANGSDSLRFVVDTGASTTVLNTRSLKLRGLIHEQEKAENIGTTGSSQITISHDNHIKVGTVEYARATCANIPFGPADQWDGVLGLNALRAFNIEINYDDRTIYVYSKKNSMEADSSYVVLPFKYKHDVPFITLPVKIQGKVYWLSLEVDTGSDRVIDLATRFVANNNLLATAKPFATSHITSSDGGSGELKNVFFDEVTIGRYILPRVAGALSTINGTGNTGGMSTMDDIDGIMGNNFLKRFNMLIDFKRNIIYLKPNELLYTPFYEFLGR